jgi:hypothetical protein
MKIAALMIATAATLSACVPANPIVSDFNGDSVKIVTDAFSDAEQAKAAAQVEAAKICATRGRKPQFASSMALPEYKVQSLWLCL